MPDISFTTMLVAVGSDGQNGVVYYESADGKMKKVASSSLVKNATTAVIPAYQNVYFADGTNFKYAKFTVSTPTWNTWSTASGSMPSDANIGCLYRGRIVLAGDSSDPNMWYMSRQGTVDCWTYGANDAQSAVAGGNAEAAKTPDIITATIPYSDDLLVFGGAHTVHLLRGDPCAGGVIDLLLSCDGIFGPDSWCHDSEGNLYFMGTAGLYRMERGGSIPKPLNITRIPNMMDGIDRENYRITMAYDAVRHGVLICMTKISDGTGTHYWYDVRTDGFFPESYLSGMGPYSMVFYDSDNESYRGLLLGCDDGYIRKFDEDSKSDEATTGSDVAIDSKVLLGPVDISSGKMQGKLTDLIFTLGSDTDNVDYDIFVNNSAEELLDDVTADSSGIHSGSITDDGRRNNIRTKARGAALAIKLSNSTEEKSFALEKVVGDVKPAGRLKI